MRQAILPDLRNDDPARKVFALVDRSGIQENRVNELQRILIADGVGAPPAHILEVIDDEQAHRRIQDVPHTIYEEIWHLLFWMDLSLNWIGGALTPYPAHASDGFPSSRDEPWFSLKDRFLDRLKKAANLSGDIAAHDTLVTCPSREHTAARTMSARDQIEGIAAHNAYHLGRIVLIRQLMGTWPPPSGGDTW